MPEVPPRLIRNNRPVIQDFQAEEPLYRRFSPVQQVDSQFPHVSFAFPDISVNRGGRCTFIDDKGKQRKALFSCAKDAIINNPSYGVIKVSVSDVPRHLQVDGGVLYEFRVEHDPEELNYSHSEMRVYIEGVHSQKSPSKLVRKEFRMAVCKNHEICIQAQPLPPSPG